MSFFRPTDRALILAASLACSALAWSAPPPQPQPLWLSVRAGQGEPGDDRLLLGDQEGRLWASAGDLDDWGLQAPAGESIRFEDSDWYPLEAQPHLRSRFDAAQQALWVDVDPQLRRIQLRQLSRSEREAHREGIEPGGWIDADLQWTQADRDSRIAGLFGARVFDDLGFGSTDLFVDGRNLVRLDSTWSREHPQDFERLDLGDGILRPGAWGRALRFGGVSFGTDFSLQPDLVTFPQPQIEGVAGLPSTLDLYVNGQLARRERVDAGPFVLSGVPVQSGQNEATLIVRDLLGREQVLSQPFYAAASLLRPGLVDARVEAGWLRRNYALESFDYGSAFASAGARKGLNEGLTVEARGELQRERQATGFATAFVLPLGGVAETALAGSHARPGVVGSLVQAGASWQGRRGANLGVRVRRPTRGWTELGEKAPAQRAQSSLNLGWAPIAGWSTSLTWVRQTALAEVPADLLSLGLGTRIGRGWFVNASLVRTEQDGVDTYAGIGVIGVWGRHTTLVETRQSAGRDGRSFEWQQNPGEVLGDRYRLRVEDGASHHLLAESEWTAERGRFGLAYADRGEERAVRASAAARMAWLGSDLFWTRAGAEGFAVVDAHGLADVGVLQDNRLAARTDARGLALLPGLRAYQDNRVGLVDADIPIDANVQALERTVVPTARGGLRVDLAVRDSRGRGFRLLMPDGRVPPTHAKVRDPATGLAFTLGQDGLAWWPHGEAPDRLAVEVDGLRCRAGIPREPGVDTVLQLSCSNRS